MIKLEELKDIVIDDIDYKDYPDFCDAYVQEAYWKDTGIELTPDEYNDIDPSDLNNYIHLNNAEMRSYLTSE